MENKPMDEPLGALTPLRVLVVEDYRIISMGLESIVEELGHEVVDVVGSGAQAIKAARDHRPDIVLMDINLSGEIDGIDAAIQIRDRFEIRSIFFTGYSDPETRARAQSAEPVAFLEKTSSSSQIAQALQLVATNTRDKP